MRLGRRYPHTIRIPLWRRIAAELGPGSGMLVLDRWLGKTVQADPGLVDLDCDAVGTAAWAPVNGAVLSKVAGVAPGSMRALRVGWNGAANPSARQVGGMVANTYYFGSGYIDNSASATQAQVDLGPGGTMYLQAAGASGPGSGIAKSGIAHYDCQLVGGAAGDQADFDDMAIEPRSVIDWHNAIAWSGDSVVATPGANNAPYWQANAGVWSLTWESPANSQMVSTLPAATYDYLMDGSGCTVVGRFLVRSLPVGRQTLWDNARTVTGSVVRVLGAAFPLEIQFRCVNGGVAVFTHGALNSVVQNTWHVFSLRYAEGVAPQVTCRFDGADVYRGVRAGVAPAAAAAQALHIGCLALGGFQLEGAISSMIFVPRYCRDAELEQLEREMVP